MEKIPGVSPLSSNLVQHNKFVQLYAAISTPMKQRKLVTCSRPYSVKLAFSRSRKRQLQETGSYTVTKALKIILVPVYNAWLLCFRNG